MPSLWFVMPVHGRQELARICMRQLRRTCDRLIEQGVEASAVVVGLDNLETARELGFATVRRDNQYLSRKFNDGIQLACDPRYNPRPADYVVPVGSDDWVDWKLFHNLPGPDTMVGFPNMSFVREDGAELTAVRLDYPGGSGIRIWPRSLMKRLGYRPALESLKRGCDTSILVNVQREVGCLIEHRESDPRQIVDWKTAGENVNAYLTVTTRWRSEPLGDPYDALRDMYPADALEAMQRHHGMVMA